MIIAALVALAALGVLASVLAPSRAASGSGRSRSEAGVELFGLKVCGTPWQPCFHD